MNKIKKIELLSPVGDERGLKAAVNSGANGVYFGAKSFNAREYAAENFDDKAIDNAIKFAKLRNVKVYITVNTLVYNDEIDKALSNYLKAIARNDAFAPAYKKAGILFFARGDFEDAIEYFEDYTSLDIADEEKAKIQELIERIKKKQNA